jgi:GNAT superfamily N-acetyltransferase
MPPAIEVVRTHLVMHDVAELRRSRPPSEDARIERWDDISTGAYRSIYKKVGEPWSWRDRLVISDEELAAYLALPGVSVWALRVDGDVAGFFELQRYDDGRVEIMYFGLALDYIGRGLGGWMLTSAVEEAVALGAAPLTLHPCTLDNPHALPNYLARGFTITREERYTVEPVTAG